MAVQLPESGVGALLLIRIGVWMNLKRSVGRTLRTLGVNPHTIPIILRERPSVRRDLKTLEAQRSHSNYATAFPMGMPYPIYGERSESAGTASGHYFHQDLLVAREIYSRKPIRHIDVGSRIDGFVAHLASFRQVEVVDIRPLPAIQGIEFIQADIMNLPMHLEGAADSVSCLHALEHFGLGRYGDPVDFDGWLKGLESLTRMVQQGGRLYFSVPTAREQRIEFNAHRVFSLPFIRDRLAERFEISRCSFVQDDGSLTEDLDPCGADAERSFGAEHGCSMSLTV